VGLRTGARASGQRTGGLRSLRAAYRSGEIRRLRALWSEQVRSQTGALLPRVVERFYPVSRFLELAGQLEERIAQGGLVVAARWLLDTYTPGWSANAPAGARAALASEPVILYGNHPSLLTPFLVAAAVGRPDLRIVSASFIERLVPSYASSSITVELPLERWREPLVRDGVRRAVATRLLVALHGVVPREVAKRRNEGALEAAVAHVRSGGSLLIAPGGGGRREPTWHPGLASILRRLDGPEGGDTLLVPYCEEHALDFLLTGLLRRGPADGVGSSRTEKRKVHICFGVPTRAAQWGAGNECPELLMWRLRRHYEGLFERSRLCLRATPGERERPGA